MKKSLKLIRKVVFALLEQYEEYKKRGMICCLCLEQYRFILNYTLECQVSGIGGLNRSICESFCWETIVL